MISFLQYLLESRSVIISDLCSIFGEKIVFNDQKLFNLDFKNTYKICQSLNKTLFNNRLSQIPILVGSQNTVIQEIKNRNKNAYIPKAFYGTHLIKYDIYLNGVKIDNISTHKFSGLEKIIFFDELLVINTSFLKNSNFIFAVCCIAHELIHAYDSHFGDYPKLVLRLFSLNRKIDSHKTITFKYKMTEAHNKKLNVISSGEDISFKDLNDQAYQKLLSEVEQKPLPLIQLSDGKIKLDFSKMQVLGDIYPSTDGSGSGDIIHFDY